MPMTAIAADRDDEFRYCRFRELLLLALSLCRLAKSSFALLFVIYFARRCRDLAYGARSRTALAGFTGIFRCLLPSRR